MEDREAEEVFGEGGRSLHDTARAGRLKDRLRLSVINIAEAEAHKLGMEVSQPVMTCLADLTFKFTEQLARDLEMFAQHAGRKSVNMDDVILAARRNEDVAVSLKSISRELLKGKEQQIERKRKKSTAKGEKPVD